MVYDPAYSQFIDMTRRLFPQFLPMIPMAPPSLPAPPGKTPPEPVPAVSDSNIIFVEGDAGAAAYQVPPGGKTVLFDSLSDRVYIKTADADGKPHTKYSEIVWQDFRAPDDPANRFVTVDDFRKFKSELTAALEKIAANASAQAAPKEASENA